MLACVLSGAEIRAQLAITEVMSWASTNCAGCTPGNRGCRPDFWELTNFGTNTIDLTDYLFADRENPFPDPRGEPWRLPPVGIRPRESIIFVRQGWDLIPDAAAFRDWWGDSNLPADLKIFFYPVNGYGLDELGDAVRLFDPNSNAVDQVYFNETRRGFTFTYDLNSGAAAQSALGICGAFQAVACADVGSPGWASCGPVALQITQQPVSQTSDAGSEVTFSVRAHGLPRPRYQWYFNDVPLASAGATNFSIPRLVGFAGCGPAWIETPVPPDLTIHNVQPSHAGEYFVEVFNGLGKLTSAVVRLTVNTNPTPVRLECPPASVCTPGEVGSSAPALVVAPGQAATFTVIARGYPLPTFQWSWNRDGQSFIDLPSETNGVLTIPSVQTTDAGIYCVRVQNPGGVTNASATLVVKPKPQLQITEAMSHPCFPAANDWWELTNLGEEPVDLCGYRWDDRPGNVGGGPTVSNSVVVHPGESVIFLEGRTPEFFIIWWGASNLPHGLQFVTYTANGLEPGDGDEINIWNPTASIDSDWVDSVGFSTATLGASFWFDPNVPCSEYPFGVPSVAGECGAFRSAQGCDVGSPGWTPWTPPRFTAIRRNGSTVNLEWRAQPGSTTVAEYTSDFASRTDSTRWTNLPTESLAGATGRATDTVEHGTPQRFYRVKMIPPANCPCPTDD